MFDETQPASLMLLAIAAVLIASTIGMLPRSKVRTSLITVWSLIPTLLILFVGLTFAWKIQVFDPGTLPIFPAIFVIIVQPPWLLLTLLPFGLVRRYREIQRWDI